MTTESIFKLYHKPPRQYYETFIIDCKNSFDWNKANYICDYDQLTLMNICRTTIAHLLKPQLFPTKEQRQLSDDNL